MNKIFILITVLILASCSPQSEKTSNDFDTIFQGGTIVDGLGNSSFKADIGIKGGIITKISKESLNINNATETINIEGLTLSPGFIDNHAHIQTTIHEHPLAENFIHQGITTIMAALHSGDQPWPLDEYASNLEVSPNIGFFAGHSWIRTQVLGLENRAPTETELQRMRDLTTETMKQGALGISTGLLYVPANFAETEEVIELSKIAGEYGGVYVTHMRDEAMGLLDSVRETIRIADEANIPAQINHHKAIGVSQWGWSKMSLKLIDEANARGLDVKHDLYPYTASSTRSAVLFPQWALSGGRDEFTKRVANPETREKMEKDMMDIFQFERTGGDLNRVQFRVLYSDPSYNGKTLGDFAHDLGLDNNLENGIDITIDLQLKGGFSAIFHAMDEEDVIRILTHPLAMIETDGDPVSYGVGHPHPRSYGAFPRVLARYVRDLKVLTLEEAIKKMTSMPANQFNQPLRGRIIEGAIADITIFDPDTIQDTATYEDPHNYAVGINHVMVGGEFAKKYGALTGNKPGVWIRGPSRPDRLVKN